MNRFIVIEGVDNVGKTSTAKMLAERLNELGEPSIYYKTPPSEFAKTTQIINKIAPTDAHYLYHASMILMAQQEIGRLLVRNTVICDRWVHSTIAYHTAFGSKVKVNLEDIALTPNLEILLLVEEAERMRRASLKESPESYDLVSMETDPRISLANTYLKNMVARHLDSTNLSLKDTVEAILKI